MSNTIENVTIVGGGDAGLITALSIRQLNPGINVTVVDDFREEVPQVGKSTFWRIYGVLHEKLNIDERRLIEEVRPVWKCSVYFRDWCGYRPFHYPFDESTKFPDLDSPRAGESCYYHYHELYDDPGFRTKNEEMVHQGKSPWYFEPSDFTYQKYEPIAYHLDTRRFNAFLRELCEERGISLVNDEITGVDVRDNRIRQVKSETQTYASDLYVDATGFDRVIKGELDDEFREFDLPLDSALNTRYDRPLSEIEPATVVETGDHGWFWQIDTFDNRDLGYVYASEYASEAEARQEFLEHCGEEVSGEDVIQYGFTSGYFPEAWEENLVTIGNAQGFVEPLQSTGLTINALAATNLSNLLAAHGRIMDDRIRDSYNAWLRQSWETTADFIATHYRFGSGDTAFWEDMTSMEVSPRLERIIEEFDRNGFDTHPTRIEGGMDDLTIFHPRNFYALMRNMGATSEFYESNEFEVSDELKQAQEKFYREIKEDVENYFTTEEVYNLFDEEGMLSG